jgi:putative SOS response-associated peptidase YedK
MCGRYALNERADILVRTFNLVGPADFPARFNIAPQTPVPVIRNSPAGRRADLVRWGLIPHWARDAAIGARLINARAETLAEKPAFRSAFRSRRCLIPASGFYEWQPTPHGKQPWFIRAESGVVLALAGVWDSWRTPEGAILETCAIVTTEANDLLRRLHERMPVIIGPGDYEAWLSAPPADALAVARPFPSGKLRTWPVSTRVNRATEEGPDLVNPVTD